MEAKDDFLKEIMMQIARQVFREDRKLNMRKIDKITVRTMLNALEEIQEILENDSYDDFMCIEEIVRVYEKMGSGCHYRHDFG